MRYAELQRTGILLVTVFRIMWHVDPLLGSDREIRNYTIAVARY
jgi:hypothetical protein